MCGFVGVISKDPIDLAIIQKMNDTLIHRGPNSYGYLSTNDNINLKGLSNLQLLNPNKHAHIAFGHRRLAIHDLSANGHQPMSYLNRYWIIFNGEIYNFIELRAELSSKGYRFNSHTDTEVVMAAYDYWGMDCVNKFNGDWAFVLLDTLKNKIFITRDRFGVKPLYYYMKPGFFIFASEIKAIISNPQVNKTPNIAYLKNYLKYGAQAYLKETAFENISHFNFSSYFHGNIEALLHPEKMQLRKYWDVQFNLSMEKINKEKLNNYAAQYYQLLEDAVRVRLRSDVKMGANLSGGLDSSSILYLICKLNEKNSVATKLDSFSSVYHTPGTKYCDESRLITEIATLLSVQSYQIEPNIMDIPAEHRKMIYHLDSPPDSTLMSSWYTAKLGQINNIKVTLSGEGADEQLAGYLRYLIYYFSNLPLRDLFNQYRCFKHLSGAHYYIFIGMLANCSRHLLGKRLTQTLFALSGRSEKLFMSVNEKLSQDLFGCLVTLHHIDEHTFMAHTIEQRVPFMDYRLVEFLASIPMSYKLANGWTKYLARHTFDNLLPPTIIWNKKKYGWSIPETFWFKGELKGWMQETINHSGFLKKYNLLNRTKRKSLVQQIRLLNLAIWSEVFFNNNPPLS